MSFTPQQNSNPNPPPTKDESSSTSAPPAPSSTAAENTSGEGGKQVKMKRIGILTSGGDCSGMNAAVRAVVRMGIVRGCETFVIREGWEGLVRGNESESNPVSPPSSVQSSPTLRPTDTIHSLASSAKGTEGSVTKEVFKGVTGEGELLKQGEGEVALKGKHIIRCRWDDVRGFLSEGGTLIGTARSKAFRERPGRKKAAKNLIKHGIDALVVCGGDGSLTGADFLRKEWSELVKELRDEGEISEEQAGEHKNLNIVGLVGSIDNDMAMTDLTIGASTALHRICEAVDSISSTASSHSRAFVVEVMGRHCGWLALMAGMSTGADYVFIPERPPQTDDWKTEMCDVLRKHRQLGKRKSIVIVAEGAISRDLEPIKADDVKNVLTEKLGLDTRVTTLGHTQRGGKPCAYDRVLATLQGVEAVEALLAATPDTPSPMIGLVENKIIRRELMEAVKETQEVATAIENKDFAKAMSLRDPEFEESLKAFEATTALDDAIRLPENQRLKVAIMHIGAPAGGMNAATRTAVRYCLARGHTPLGVYNGFVGLLEDHVVPLSWLRVDQWTTRGGSELGTNRTLPDVDVAGVAAKFKEHGIQAFLLIGGFEALSSLLILEKARKEHPEFKIPMVQLPATISNNVPVTDWSLGSDTSVNALVEACDAIKQSASASRNRVFVVETQGGQCGYISTIGALAVGAVVVYTPEYGVSLKTLLADVEWLKHRYRADMKGKSEGRLVIKSEKASSVYKLETLTSILRDEGDKLFDSRSVALGHVLQGGTPTPRDRSRAVRLAVKCVQFLERQGAGVSPSQLPAGSGKGDAENDIAVLAVDGARLRFVGLEEMVKGADMKNRRGKEAWWKKFKALSEVLAGRVDLEGAPLSSEGLESLVVAGGVKP